jgi:hypothetical protein
VNAEIPATQFHDRSKTMDNDVSTFNLQPRSVVDAMQALFKSLGEPRRIKWVNSDYNQDHPVFGLAEHFQAHDQGHSGYTANPWRGDHLSLPGWHEEGGVFVLETSFHKGQVIVERIDYPDAPDNIQNALEKLLQQCETR